MSICVHTYDICTIFSLAFKKPPVLFRVFLRALQGDVPKTKEDDEIERKELASKQSPIPIQRR